MTESLIFLKKSASGSFSYNHFDCCERLGEVYMSYSSDIMYVLIPKKECNPFFLNDENLQIYLNLIFEMFNIKYTIANEDFSSFDVSQTKALSDRYGDFITIKVERNKKWSNKHFNSSYNYFRYLWYKHYTNMAILATNLYKLKLFTDVEDIFGIASSYQTGNNRAALPKSTTELKGLLFFRSKNEIHEELAITNTFNGVFYKYPVFFNPIVEVKGTFFSEASDKIMAKESFDKLTSIDDIENIPPFFMKSLHLITNDYLKMKVHYQNITRRMKDLGVYPSNAVLLSVGKSVFTIPVVNAYGNSDTLEYNIETGYSSKSDKKEEKVELPF